MRCEGSCGTRPWPIFGRLGSRQWPARPIGRRWPPSSRRWGPYSTSRRAATPWRRPSISASTLRNALWPLGELGRILVSLQDAQALAEALGDQHRLGWVSAYLLAHFVADMRTGPAPSRLGQRALAIAADLGDVGLTVTAQYYLGIVYRSLGDYRRAVEFYRKNVACLHGALLQERFGLPGLASALSRSLLVSSLAECGAFTEGRAPAEEGVQIAEAADHPYSRVLAYWAVGFRALRQGDLPQAIPVLERALDLAQGAHIRLLVPQVAASLGAAYALAGRIAEALPLLEQAVEQAVAMRFMFDHALRVVWLGEAYLRAGRLDEAAPRRSGPWSSPGRIRNGATKPTPCGSSARSRRRALRQRPSRPKPTTSRPSPWPRSSACARSRRIATSVSARCIARWDG